MADSGSIGFGFRLLHLSLFTFLYVSAAVLIAMNATIQTATYMACDGSLEQNSGGS